MVSTAIDPRRAWQLALGCWLPFVACAAVDRMVGVPVEPVVRDLGNHTRLLVAIPLYLVGERLLRRLGAEVLMRLGREELTGDLRMLERLARGIEGFLGSRIVTVTLALLALGFGQHLFWSHKLTQGPASIWYAWLAFPVFAFTFARYCLRWLVWDYIIWRISRMPLRTTATHPDRSGGISFTTLPIIGFLPLVLGSTAVAAATWATRIHAGAASLGNIKEPLALWASVALVVAVLPYLAFVPLLFRTRRRELRQLDRLAITYSRMFHERWIEHEAGPELLGTSDIQSLNDLAGPYGVVRRMRLVPLGLRRLIPVLVAVALPFVPVVLMVVPLSKLLLRAAQSLAGVGD